MKVTVFPGFSLQDYYQRLVGTYCLHSQGRRVSQSGGKHLFATYLCACFTFLQSRIWRQYFPPKRRRTSIRLLYVALQKIVLCNITVMKSSVRLRFLCLSWMLYFSEDDETLCTFEFLSRKFLYHLYNYRLPKEEPVPYSNFRSSYSYSFVFILSIFFKCKFHYPCFDAAKSKSLMLSLSKLPINLMELY
jgi:hypothetical protein